MSEELKDTEVPEIETAKEAETSVEQSNVAEEEVAAEPSKEEVDKDRREIEFAEVAHSEIPQAIPPEMVAAIMKAYGKDLKAKEEAHKRVFPQEVASKRLQILRWIGEGKTKRFIHKELGVSRSMIEDYIRQDAELSQAWKDAQEDRLDFHEENIDEIAAVKSDMELIEGVGSVPRNDGRIMTAAFNASKFYLERMGKARGWTPKIETCETGAGGRVPMIFVGNLTDSEIAAEEEKIREINRQVELELQGITKA